MTEIGNDLTVDGTVTARQASRAGEAVVLGSDGLIPADLLPATSGNGGVKQIILGQNIRVVSGIPVEGAVQSSATSNISMINYSSLENTLSATIKRKVINHTLISIIGPLESVPGVGSTTRPEYYKILSNAIPQAVCDAVIASLPVEYIGEFKADFEIWSTRGLRRIFTGSLQVEGDQSVVLSSKAEEFNANIYGDEDGTFSFAVKIIAESVRPLDR